MSGGLSLLKAEVEWSGHWESDPDYKTPSLAYYHYTMARKIMLSLCH